MKSLTVAAALVLCASPVFAADDPHGNQDARAVRIETGILHAIYAGTLAVHAYDARTSLDVFDLGGREVDPVLRPLMSHPSVFIAVNLARAVAIDLGVHAIGKRHRIVAIAVGVTINSGFLAIAAHNRQVADTMRSNR